MIQTRREVLRRVGTVSDEDSYGDANESRVQCEPPTGL